MPASVSLSGAALIVGLIVGTAGWLGTLTGHGNLIPPQEWGRLEVVGFLLVVPAAFILKAKDRHARR